MVKCHNVPCRPSSVLTLSDFINLLTVVRGDLVFRQFHQREFSRSRSLEGNLWVSQVLVRYPVTWWKASNETAITRSYQTLWTAPLRYISHDHRCSCTNCFKLFLLKMSTTFMLMFCFVLLSAMSMLFCRRLNKQVGQWSWGILSFIQIYMIIQM